MTLMPGLSSSCSEALKTLIQLLMQLLDGLTDHAIDLSQLSPVGYFKLFTKQRRKGHFFRLICDESC